MDELGGVEPDAQDTCRAAMRRALAAFNNSSGRLALAVGGGVLRQSIDHWTKSGRVPAEHCMALSRATGVPVWELRPDDWWRIWPNARRQRGAPPLPVGDGRVTHARREQSA